MHDVSNKDENFNWILELVWITDNRKGKQWLKTNLFLAIPIRPTYVSKSGENMQLTIRWFC